MAKTYGCGCHDVFLSQTQFNVRLLDFALGAPLDRVCGVRGHVVEECARVRLRSNCLEKIKIKT